jgi:hypothetical protein
LLGKGGNIMERLKEGEYDPYTLYTYMKKKH